ncbi:DUF2809 domain-containing protein [Ktedonospora formicarum]|uniref:Membrane protein n=1 Tax=Ktedonospora formicarum TaxID=2778364 RepID=A0A8J3MNT4_9CHLR|nr:DUF2809 domain-containing protein [Ktedonospora formicarum]GHO42235.1 membrane protein [Ktedonospora formicarum]
MSKGKKRGLYFLMFLLLLTVEILIAIFVHDAFVRPYIGDILAVGGVYSFLRIFLPERVAFLPLYVFLIAFTVEILQFFDVASLIGSENTILQIIVGSVFDWNDITCYAIGCAMIAVLEVLQVKMTRPCVTLATMGRKGEGNNPMNTL